MYQPKETPYRRTVWDAVDTHIVAGNTAYTMQDFARVGGFKPTRHLRDALETAVEYGTIRKFKAYIKSGHLSWWYAPLLMTDQFEVPMELPF